MSTKSKMSAVPLEEEFLRLSVASRMIEASFYAGELVLDEAIEELHPFIS